MHFKDSSTEYTNIKLLSSTDSDQNKHLTKDYFK